MKLPIDPEELLSVVKKRTDSRFSSIKNNPSSLDLRLGLVNDEKGMYVRGSGSFDNMVQVSLALDYLLQANEELRVVLKEMGTGYNPDSQMPQPKEAYQSTSH